MECVCGFTNAPGATTCARCNRVLGPRPVDAALAPGEAEQWYAEAVLAHARTL